MMNQTDTIGPINLGNPNEEFSVKDLATLIVKETGSSSNIVYQGLR